MSFFIDYEVCLEYCIVPARNNSEIRVRTGDVVRFGILNRSDMTTTPNTIDITATHERAEAAEWLIEQLRAIETNTLTSIQFDAFRNVVLNVDSVFLKGCFEEYQRRKDFQVAVSTAS